MSMSLNNLGFLLTANQKGKLAAGVLLLHDMPLCTNPELHKWAAICECKFEQLNHRFWDNDELKAAAEA